MGGQAVIDGVMMRSPNALAVAVRRKGGAIVIREAPWKPLLGNWRFLRWPFLRGAVVLLESLQNGISALNFSARIAMEDEAHQAGDTAPVKEQGDLAIWGTVAFALALGVGLFIALPHLAVWLGSRLMGHSLGVQDVSFHAIAGLVKLCVFVVYIGLISLMADVRRVFMYHGAEHVSIYAFEAGQPLEVAYAKRHPPMHPRCGTTFLIMVIGLSIVVFALAFPLIVWLIGAPTGVGLLDQGIYILIKLPLLFPIAGLAYEFQRLTSRFLDRWWARALAWPGMFVQRLTTRPPTDDQIEVALASLHKVLWRERVGAGAADESVQTFPDFASLVRELEATG